MREKRVSVLAFPEPRNFPHPEKSAKFLGEIYINRDVAKGNEDALVYLLIHGLLHLLGYDHRKKSDTMRMERLEKKLFLRVIS